MHNKIDLVIFDCDGVVIDSEIVSAQVLINMLAPLNVNIDSAFVQQHFLGCNFKTVTQIIANDFNVQLSADFEKQYRDALVKEFLTQLKPTNGIEEVLSQLAVPFCIATSSSPERTEKALNTVNLATYFGSNVFTSSEVKHGKPAPDLFLHAANKMAISPENALVIEDSKAGVSAGLSANMQVLHYCGGLHLQKGVNHVPSAFNELDVLAHWQEFFNVYPALRK
ncbi:HAD family hydrolase [Pseudoalteromonas sp. MMG010]|uniref:HAD family hydrolase n=1 Tax=Pseudoalteromonas sp. MMG010 TaxID=2822685 RepID=UPI001B3A2C8B|nr:HAD family hydrolase [Pseudoalteromonas sp. MMG010]MBQ4833817.1 HAD family hydrolase [Pseudoalteromonas sp. MMG010]